MSFSPPSSSLAAQATSLLLSKFPSQLPLTPTAIVISASPSTPLLSPWLASFSHCINDSLVSSQISSSVLGYYLLPQPSTPVSSLLISALQSFFLKNQTTLLQVTLTASSSSQKIDSIRAVRQTVETCFRLHPNASYDVHVTGFDALGVDLQTSVLHTLTLLDCVALPLSIAVLLWLFRSFLLLLIPCVTIAVSTALSFAVMLPLTLVTDVYGVAPALMLSVICAMSIDYSVFLLSRYSHELIVTQDASLPPHHAVRTALATSGRVVVISGVLFALCFASVGLFPVAVVRSVGLSCVVALLVTLVVSITLTPTLLLCFPCIFTLQSPVPCSSSCVAHHRRSYPTIARPWRCLASAQSSKWIASLLLLLGLALVVPPCGFLADFFWSVDTTQIIPRRSEFNAGLQTLSSIFPPGMMYPQVIVVTGAPNAPLDPFSHAFFAYTTEFIQSLSAENAPSFAPSGFLCFNAAAGHVATPRELKRLASLPAFQRLAATFVSPDASTVRCLVVPTTDISLDPIPVISTLRATLARLDALHNTTSFVQSLVVDGVDSVQTAMRWLPPILLLLFSLLFVFSGLFFLSVVVPLRLVLSILLTAGFVFGVTSLVFCTPYFDAVPSVERTNGVYWGVPLITLPVIIGLALDYDVFLFCRILEFRKQGLSSREAIARGVESNGALISGCGIVMALSFAGLALSDMALMRLFAFVLVGAVLLDTFVIRILVGPSVMQLLGEANWFPRRFPRANNAGENRDEEVTPLLGLT